MTEKDFWTKYCRAEYLHRTKNSVAAEAEAAEDEDLAVFLRHDDILANEARRKVLFLVIWKLVMLMFVINRTVVINKENFEKKDSTVVSLC